ncbi:peptidoglycan/LPS O-acetylase OafA/YrhL [Kribbella aluminosa]|uniref:Peptidoglycan/LPS O-acetylase OafA/YrhL n=1 Tax=Kribbella aluminosa TaxID=416017 RepID=A0ABS4V0F7_9ACTN|nr:acyltransferase [Kribbella aluminosa]MBP2357281.1 peptidoglycan/LPS O-acetylase OafA/YrhL [Kribbella aluminosa]
MKGTRFPAVDGLRVIAAVAVVISQVGLHTHAPFAGVVSRLDVGWAIFCALSGFLLYRPHVLAWFSGTLPPLTLPYLRSRALRILPTLLVAVLLSIAFVPHPATTYLRWAALTPLPFYLLLPGLGRLLTGYERPTRRSVRWRLLVLVALTVLGPVWMAVVTATDNPAAGLWLPGYLGWYAVGMGMALWQVARATGRLGPSTLDTLTRIPGTLWGIAIALLLIAATPIAGPYDHSTPTPAQALVKSLLYTLAVACALFPVLTPTASTVRVLGGRPAQVAAPLAYGVVVYQFVVLGLLDGPFAVQLPLTLLAAGTLAAISYRLLERPLGKKRPTAKTESSATSPSSSAAR